LEDDDDAAATTNAAEKDVKTTMVNAWNENLFGVEDGDDGCFILFSQTHSCIDMVGLKELHTSIL